jgi:hypothetical protein
MNRVFTSGGRDADAKAMRDRIEIIGARELHVQRVNSVRRVLLVGNAALPCRHSAGATCGVDGTSYADFALRRAAQYFFIRRLTARRAAGDIFRRRCVWVSMVSPDIFIERPALRALVVATALRPPPRSGNARRRPASSAWSSFQRASAPRRARARIDDECFGIVGLRL